MGFACGDLVAGIVNERERAGSYAEYLTVPVSEIVRKPSGFTLVEAAAYPTVAVAAWRYLVRAAAVRAGERVLVHGGAGGTGSMIVQWAKARGAYVIAPVADQYRSGLSAGGHRRRARAQSQRPYARQSSRRHGRQVQAARKPVREVAEGNFSHAEFG